MKLYGYKEGSRNERGPAALSEVTVVASPHELRAIARLLGDVAIEMECASFDHVHLADRVATFIEGPQLVFMKAD
ncbi:hypothetical protein [Rhodanobacter sp. MP7CTX1]|uniref:hypothetical protein n=1 Tax=Rhodanobacter sp. MP7CTX1 TaxID=2723084 RepID=UPI0016165F8C|nr:hypothetical protein [Rhodanobacter sp. MP7CTX1]MBB6189219.1 hypothetical protein [Rhodanobacter sp. MP7CTX1]